jgi:hypothetical protein
MALRMSADGGECRRSLSSSLTAYFRIFESGQRLGLFALIFSPLLLGVIRACLWRHFRELITLKNNQSPPLAAAAR